MLRTLVYAETASIASAPASLRRSPRCTIILSAAPMARRQRNASSARRRHRCSPTCSTHSSRPRDQPANAPDRRAAPTLSPWQRNGGWPARRSRPKVVKFAKMLLKSVKKCQEPIFCRARCGARMAHRRAGISTASCWPPSGYLNRYSAGTWHMCRSSWVRCSQTH
jgi:hypothetical protein